MDALFCSQCRSILDIPADEDFIICSVCGERQAASMFEESVFVTKSRSNAFMHALKKRMAAAASATKAEHGATIKERCPKCNNPEMTFHTMQLRSADEGQTVFYACPKCHYKYKVNT